MTMLEDSPTHSGSDSPQPPDGTATQPRPKAHRPFKWVIRGTVLALVGWVLGVAVTIGIRGGTPTDEIVVIVAYIFALRGSPFFDFLLVDARWHHEWAGALARGEWDMAGRAFFRAPLYPFWLSVLYRVFGEDLLAVRLVQRVLGAGTASLLAGAARRMAG